LDSATEFICGFIHVDVDKPLNGAMVDWSFSFNDCGNACCCLFELWFHGGLRDPTVLLVFGSACMECLQRFDNPIVQQRFKRADDGFSSIDRWRCHAGYVTEGILASGSDNYVSDGCVRFFIE
jgi:hypothetical protein